MAALEEPTHTEVRRIEGVRVIGEAVRRVAPERAEILIEITASAPAAAQALRDAQAKAAQVAQATAPLGVQASDIQPISLQVFTVYSPAMQALPGYGLPQIGPPGFAPYGGASADVQLGSYVARHTLQLSAREPGRMGEIVDAATRAGAMVAGPLSLRVADETSARRSVLEAAARDARGRAEALAAAVGKQLGEPIAITEEVVASDGALTALRAAAPHMFGTAVSRPAGELEYFARVSANFRFQ